MINLDQKLREIYDKIGDSFYWEGTMGKGDPDIEEHIHDVIEDIKQVFKEAGYRLSPIDLGYARSDTKKNKSGIKSITYRDKPIPFTNMSGYAIFETNGHKITDFKIEYEDA